MFSVSLHFIYLVKLNNYTLFDLIVYLWSKVYFSLDWQKWVLVEFCLFSDTFIAQYYIQQVCKYFWQKNFVNISRISHWTFWCVWENLTFSGMLITLISPLISQFFWNAHFYCSFTSFYKRTFRDFRGWCEFCRTISCAAF